MAKAFRNAGRYKQMRRVMRESENNPFVDYSRWRDKFEASATLAQHVGNLLSTEAEKLKKELTTPPRKDR